MMMQIILTLLSPSTNLIFFSVRPGCKASISTMYEVLDLRGQEMVDM
jgi:hypothetical protein